MRLTKIILALGVMLGFAQQASATLFQFTFNSAPFYTDFALTTPEGGSVSGVAFYDDSVFAFSNPLFHTTAGSIIMTDFVLDTMISSLAPPFLIVGDAVTASHFAVSNYPGDVGDHLAAALDGTQTGPNTFTVEFIEAICTATGCESPDGVIFRYASVDVTISPAPEPLTIGLFTAGLLGLGAVRKRARAG